MPRRHYRECTQASDFEWPTHSLCPTHVVSSDHLLLAIYRTIFIEAERRREERQALRSGRLRATSEGRDLSSSGPRRGVGVRWVRETSKALDQNDSSSSVGDEEDRMTSGRGTTWKRMLEGMPFYRPDVLSKRGGGLAGSDLDQKELRPGEALHGLAQGTERSLALREYEFIRIASRKAS